MEIHPAAAAFPMLADDDLKLLADDIAANGLLHPIVITPIGQLLDGRNRLAACTLAGVEPATEVYAGDPVAYVLSANNHRRHISKGQRAMAGVIAIGANHLQSDSQLAAMIGISHTLVGWARIVGKHAPSLVERVMRPTEPMSLKAAYDEAVKIRDLPDTHPERLARLEHEAPDLAAQVTDGGLSLSEAEAAHRQREADRADRIRRNAGYLRRVVEGWQLALTIPSMVDLDEALDELSEVERAQITDYLKETK